MADELATRAQALEASDRLRRQLLADVSHELMTPLTAMRGYVETLAMDELDLDAETRRRLRMQGVAEVADRVPATAARSRVQLSGAGRRARVGGVAVPSTR